MVDRPTYHDFSESPEINYLDEELKVNVSIDSETAEDLPEITKEDLSSHTERYTVLLGEAEIINDGEVTVHIRALAQQDERDEEEYRLYNEEYMRIRVGKKDVIQCINEYCEKHPEHGRFIGDLHTHPYLKKEMVDQALEPHSPSNGDIESAIKEYEDGVLEKNSPFIFAIAAPNEQGDTGYAFYRLTEKDGQYGYQALDMIF